MVCNLPLLQAARFDTLKSHTQEALSLWLHKGSREDFLNCFRARVSKLLTSALPLMVVTRWVASDVLRRGAKESAAAHRGLIAAR